jgi:hypothetical protein
MVTDLTKRWRPFDNLFFAAFTFGCEQSRHGLKGSGLKIGPDEASKGLLCLF